jgi:hypothetical protein
MSSSSSLAAARRRRAGGANQPSGPPGRGPPPTQSTRQPSTPESSNIPPNPLMVLQQHHIKISMLDQQIQKLLSTQEIPPPVPSSVPPSVQNETDLSENPTSVHQRFDLNEVTDLLLSRIEQRIDFRALYENDQKLGGEIDTLHKIVLQQQTTLNNLNKLLYFIISSLKLELKDESLEEVEKSMEEEQNINLIVGDHRDDHSEDSMIPQTQPTFPKSIKIDLNKNETSEFTPIEDDDEGSNYEPGTEFSEDGLPIPPVD